MSMLTRRLQVLRACQLHGSRRFATQSKGRSTDHQNDHSHNLHMAVASMKVVQLSLHPNTAEVLDHQPNVRCISGAVFSDADKRAQFLNSISEREVFLMSRDHVKDFVQMQLQDAGIEMPRLLTGSAKAKSKTADSLATLPKGHPLAQIQQQLSNVKTVPMKQAFSKQLEQAKNQFKSTPLPSKPDKIKLLPSEEALLLACSNGEVDKVRSLLRQPDTHTHVNIHHLVHGGTPLHVAAFEGHLEVMKVLLDSGADVNGVAFNNSTALHWAAGAGQVDAARLLLDRGADPNHRSSTWASSVFGKGSGQTPSHWAAESGHPDILSLLHSYGAESIIAEDETGQSPLTLAQKELKSDCSNFLKKAMNEEYVAVSLSVSMQMQRNFAWNANGRRANSQQRPMAAIDGHSPEQIFDIDVQPQPETASAESSESESAANSKSKSTAKSRASRSSSASSSSSSSKPRRQSRSARN